MRRKGFIYRFGEEEQNPLLLVGRESEADVSSRKKTSTTGWRYCNMHIRRCDVEGEYLLAEGSTIAC